MVTYSVGPQIVAYTVVYDLADGTAEGNPTESDSEETIAEFFAKVATAPAKDDHTFLHWSKTADGEAINTASTEKMSTLLDDPAGTTVTLYAVYETVADEPVIVVIADVNGDGQVNITDTNAMITYVKNNLSHPDYTIGAIIPGSTTKLGDVTGDGEVNITDTNAFITYVKNNLSHPDYDFGATVSVNN